MFETKWTVMAALSVACLALPGLVRAQAPPGPLPGAQPSDSRPTAAPQKLDKPAVQPRTSIFGAWKLNPEDSDDPRKRMQQSRGSGGGG